MTATALRAPGGNERRLVTPLDVERIRADFPILKNVRIDGKPLVFLDNAASAQMPQPVIDRLVHYRTWEHANIHRGVHYLSEIATAAYEHARSIARGFLNAGEDREVIFTSNCTDGINLVAHGYGRKFIGAGDEVVITHLEHHANIVPWQMLCEEKGARLRIVPVTDAGELVLDEYERLFNPRTRFVAITHVSNALGTINPVKAMVATAHRHGVPVLIDGAQAAPHRYCYCYYCCYYCCCSTRPFRPRRPFRPFRPFHLRRPFHLLRRCCSTTNLKHSTNSMRRLLCPVFLPHRHNPQSWCWRLLPKAIPMRAYSSLSSPEMLGQTKR